MVVWISRSLSRAVQGIDHRGTETEKIAGGKIQLKGYKIDKFLKKIRFPPPPVFFPSNYSGKNPFVNFRLKGNFILSE